MNFKKCVSLFMISLLLMALIGCAVTKKPPAKENQTPKPNASEKAPTEKEKEEQTPKNEEKVEGPTTAKDVKDGEYEGKTEKDERGNYGVAKITVKDKKITEAEYKEFTEDNKPKSKENGYEYEQAMEAFDKLPDILLEKQDVSKVDTYAGATGTTKTFKAAVIKALEKGSKQNNK